MRYGRLIAWICACVSWANAQPNVIIVMTDDQGYGDLSVHGNPVLKTPNIDPPLVRGRSPHGLPRESHMRADAWQLLTGRMIPTASEWILINGRSFSGRARSPMAEHFEGRICHRHVRQMASRRQLSLIGRKITAFRKSFAMAVGASVKRRTIGITPISMGPTCTMASPSPAKGYCTDVFFNAAMAFITSQAKAKKPFLVYLATNAPHGPMHAPEEFAAPYASLGTNMAHFLGMIANIDANVGRLMKLLDSEGLTKDTILIFTTDNGTSTGDKVFNGGMRGKKGSEYDGGHRVPFFIRWPGGNIGGGKDMPQLTAHIDVFPTLLELCGIPVPGGLASTGRVSHPCFAEGKAGRCPTVSSSPTPSASIRPSSGSSHRSCPLIGDWSTARPSMTSATTRSKKPISRRNIQPSSSA